jgi:hypothetical protein
VGIQKVKQVRWQHGRVEFITIAARLSRTCRSSRYCRLLLLLLILLLRVLVAGAAAGRWLCQAVSRTCRLSCFSSGLARCELLQPHVLRLCWRCCSCLRRRCLCLLLLLLSLLLLHA